VDDLAGLKRRLRLQHRDRAVTADQLDTGIGRRRNGRRDLRTVEIAARHVRHARFRVLGPGAHLCGLLRAYCFTAPAARRSELPSRSTGLTALPSTLP